jgi:glycosyltransferase involved in cell wall biosynthesis
MKISIIIPCYNEISTIDKIIHKINKIDIEKEILIIDDFSDD